MIMSAVLTQNWTCNAEDIQAVCGCLQELKPGVGWYRYSTLIILSYYYLLLQSAWVFLQAFDLMQVRASFCGLARFVAQVLLGEARNENFKTEEMFKT